MGEEVKANGEEVLDEAEGFSEKEKAANRPGEGAEARQVRRDWVEEAWKCFIKDAGDIDPTDPVKAIGAYFRKNATDELKARCKAEGKDAKGCWKFIEAVAKKALGGRNGHIDPGVVYAIAMHWFEDVPADWYDTSAKASTSAKAKAKTARQAKPRKPAETPSEIRKEKERMAKAAKAAKAKKPKQSQGFFFEMLESPETSGQESEEDPS